jgi:UDP-glucose 4-epimerase
MLARAGHQVVAYDNLSNGHAAFAKWGRLERGDIRDGARLCEVFRAHKPDAVLHCAALIEVGESVKHPERFQDVNVVGAKTVLNVMRETNTKSFVLSSSCAVYGAPQTLPIDETHRCAPESPYGQNKLDAERLSEEAARLRGGVFVHLRYFNAAGAAPDQGIGERHHPESHAIPLALFTILGKRAAFNIYGADYETRDGTCLRDYIHVLDLATAHVSAIERLLGGGGSLAVNLGSGEGVTVRELVAVIEDATGKSLPVRSAPRRPGDVAALVADCTLARRELQWSPERSFHEIIKDAWRWHSVTEPQLFQ